MLYDNICPLLFVRILLTHSAQYCYNVEISLLIYTVNYCTGFYIIVTLGLKVLKLNSAKNTMTHMYFVRSESC